MSTFERADRGWIRREPGYLSGGDRAYVHVVDGTDESPSHSTYPTGYDPDCGWCWLGAPHSEAAHAAKIGEESSARGPTAECSCGHRYTMHKRQAHGGYACTYHGCGCNEV